jgi:hypothetical protein
MQIEEASKAGLTDRDLRALWDTPSALDAADGSVCGLYRSRIRKALADTSRGAA